MPDVVKHRGNPHGEIGIGFDLVPDPQPVESPRGQVKRPKRMSKSRVFGRLIGKISQSELTYPPEPLELRRVDQLRKQLAPF